MFEIENVLMEQDAVTLFVCRRSSNDDSLIIRKFVAECGTKWIFEISKRGKVKNLTSETQCKRDCPKCAERIAKVRALIAEGK